MMAAQRGDFSRELWIERVGYFCADLDTTPENPVLNRTQTLRSAKP